MGLQKVNINKKENKEEQKKISRMEHVVTKIYKIHMQKYQRCHSDIGASWRMKLCNQGCHTFLRVLCSMHGRNNMWANMSTIKSTQDCLVIVVIGISPQNLENNSSIIIESILTTSSRVVNFSFKVNFIKNKRQNNISYILWKCLQWWSAILKLEFPEFLSLYGCWQQEKCA